MVFSNTMATPAKLLKFRGNTVKSTLSIYILPAKIQKKRYEILLRNSQRKNLPVSPSFSTSVTHIVSECETADQVLRALKFELSNWNHDVQILSSTWLSECLKDGSLAEVQDKHKLEWEPKEVPSDELLTAESMPAYECQRDTPLGHHNARFTDAIEVLAKAADFRNDDENYSRALAFRRASCTLKSLDRPLSSVTAVKRLPNIGSHCLRVIKDIFENGFSEEVEEIKRSEWFHTMELFTAIFGVGPATAERWYQEGLRSLADLRNHPDIGQRGDDRISCGLAFYGELNLPVLRSEADFILDLVTREAERILPGATVVITGGFRRGKASGHDVDLLLSHPEEGRERDLLAVLLRRLDDLGLIFHGRWEGSSFNEDVLKTDSSKGAYLRSSLDHYEKWMGIMKIDKKHRARGLGDRAEGGKRHGGGDGCCKTNDREDMIARGEAGKSREADITVTRGSDERVALSTGSATTDTNDRVAPPLGGDDSEESAPRPPLEKRYSLGRAEGLARTPRDWYARRVDLIVAPASQYYYALVGWTGSKQFNRSLRLYAQRELKVKLTSHGMYDTGKRAACPAHSEQEVFDLLQVPYREPWQRNC